MLTTQLIDRMKANDSTAFKEVYNFYSPLFKGIAYRYLGTEDECNDLLQEAFVKIYRNIHKYVGNGSFEGWMKRILVNCCLDYIKKEHKVRFEAEDVLIDQPSAGAIDALSQLSKKEIVEVINKLPRGYRTIFNLNVVEGFSHEEIAEKLGITSSASRSQLYKAKTRLKEELAKIDIYSPDGKNVPQQKRSAAC